MIVKINMSFVNVRKSKPVYQGHVQVPYDMGITAMPVYQHGGSLKSVGRAIRRTARKAVREVREELPAIKRGVRTGAKIVRPLAGATRVVAGAIPTPEGQAVATGARVAEQLAKMAGGKRRGRPPMSGGMRKGKSKVMEMRM